MKRIILASASPRREELLRTIGLEFAVKPSCFDERSVTAWPPEEHVVQSALGKAHDVACKLRDEIAVVIGADTVVVSDDRILGKPQDAEDAAAMLSQLSGRPHFVYTGICVLDTSPDTRTPVQTAFVRTQVTFGHLDMATISAYIATGEPMDKAGAYGIQGRGSVLVESIQGDYFNVVGLPVFPLSRMLAELGIPIMGGNQ